MRPLIGAVAFVLAVGTAISAPPARATAHACEPAQDSYNCLVVKEYPKGWRNVGSLTYCFPATSRTYRYGDGSTRAAFELPVGYRKYVNAAANTWSTRPGLRVSLVETACGSKTDIVVRGFHGRQQKQKEAGEGGCAGVADKASKSYGFCAARSGRLLLSVDVPDNDTYAAFLEHAALHELGHVLGLDHPCANQCPDPVMSYANCPSTSQCPVYPNHDDVVGIQIVYGMSASGDCSVARLVERGGAGEVIGQVSRPLPPLDPELGSLPASFHEPDFGVLDRALTRPEVPVGGDVLVGATEMVRRLADPAVDAAATLATTGGVLSNELDWVLIETGLDGTVPNPARCLAV